MNRWETKNLELGQLVWTIEDDPYTGVFIKEMLFVITTEKSVITIKDGYRENKSMATYEYDDIFTNYEEAKKCAKSKQRAKIYDLDFALKRAKRIWNNSYAQDDSEKYTKGVEEHYND